MPDLDMSEVLSSDEFSDTFLVTANQGVIGSDGLDILKAGFPTEIEGVVVPGKSSLRRGSDGARVTAYIDIYTQFRLSAGYKTNDETYRDADVVTWHGRNFTVMSIEDYSAFGDGWFHASCDLLDLAPQA